VHRHHQRYPPLRILELQAPINEYKETPTKNSHLSSLVPIKSYTAVPSFLVPIPSFLSLTGSRLLRTALLFLWRLFLALLITRIRMLAIIFPFLCTSRTRSSRLLWFLLLLFSSRPRRTSLRSTSSLLAFVGLRLLFLLFLYRLICIIGLICIFCLGFLLSSGFLLRRSFLGFVFGAGGIFVIAALGFVFFADFSGL